MTTLVLGASGATGKRLVEHLLEAGHRVKVIVRSGSSFSKDAKYQDRLTVFKGSITEISVDELTEHVADCHAVVSCLGHNLTWKGIYGKPRDLCTVAVCMLCNAIIHSLPKKPVKFILMNTAGNRNKDLNEQVSLGENMVLGLLRLLLPPHSDNENAAEYLRSEIGQDHPSIEWAVVRPDTLLDAEQVSDYEVHPSPTRSALFNAGKTSRINVANFMARLVTEQPLWESWKGKMPVIYNIGTV